MGIQRRAIRAKQKADKKNQQQKQNQESIKNVESLGRLIRVMIFSSVTMSASANALLSNKSPIGSLDAKHLDNETKETLINILNNFQGSVNSIYKSLNPDNPQFASIMIDDIDRISSIIGFDWRLYVDGFTLIENGEETQT